MRCLSLLVVVVATSGHMAHAADKPLVDESFLQTPIEDALAHLPKKYGFTLSVAPQAAKVDLSQTLTARLSAIPADQALQILVEPFGLRAMVEGQAIVVTAGPDPALVRESYNIESILKSGGARAGEQLLPAIRQTVAPESWDRVGGRGSMTVKRPLLVVEQSRDVHRRLARLLKSLETTLGSEPPADKPGRAAQLDQELSLELRDALLTDAVATISERSGTRIQLSVRYAAIKDLPPITLQLPRQKLPATLDQLCQPRGLEWMATEDAILVGAAADIGRRYHPLVYSLREFPPGARDALAKELRAIEDKSWEEVGGAGSLARVGDALVVLQHPRYHRSIEGLLRSKRKQPAGAGP